MKSLPIPQEVREALMGRNPFRLEWENVEAHARFGALPTGPIRETAERLLRAITTFPPPSKDFDIEDIRVGLAGTGYRILVGTGTHVRVTVTAQYREFQRVVSVKEFHIGARALEQRQPKKRS